MTEYSSILSGDRPDEVERIQRVIAETPEPPEQWQPGDLGRLIWSDTLGRYETWLADPETGELELDLEGNPVKAAWEEPSQAASVTDPAVGAQGSVTPVTSVTLAAYLRDVRAFVCRFAAFPSEHEPVAIALWVAHARLFERLKARYETSPILAVTSAEKQSGKSRVLDVLELLVPEPRRMVLPSEAVVYTILNQDPRPTLLLDEADAIFGPRTAEKYEGLRAILNSGNRAGSPVLRVKLDGKRREVESFDVFGPKCLAGIGDLPDTVADRSIPIRMRRRRPTERVEPFRRRLADIDAQGIRLDVGSVRFADRYPDVPDQLPDRAADGWEVLLAIADAAGGSWPMVGRLAAVALSANQPSTVTTGMRLLADIREVFGDRSSMTTTELLAALCAMDDAPWSDWYGKPLTARSLARLLAPYGIEPRHSRDARGYYAVDLADAWARYVTDVTDVTGLGAPTGAYDPETAKDDDV